MSETSVKKSWQREGSYRDMEWHETSEERGRMSVDECSCDVMDFVYTTID